MIFTDSITGLEKLTKLIFLFLTVLFTNSVYGKVPAVSVSEKAVLISGPIAGSNLDPVVKELDTLFLAGERTADIILNSPGGSVTTGFLFINKMEELRARGMRLRCFVPTVAASMAFQILLHCDEKYTLDRAFVLWHRVRVQVGGFMGEPITAPIARNLYIMLQELDNVIISELLTSFPKANADEIMHHFEQESLLPGISAHKITAGTLISYPHIPNLLNKLLDPKTVKSGAADLFSAGELIYITKNKDVIKLLNVTTQE